MISLKIAWQFIRKSWFRTAIIIFTVMVSVGVQFFISGLGNILTNMILQQATTYQEHISLRGDTATTFENIDIELRDTIMNEIDEVEYAIYTIITTGTLSNDKNEEITFSLFIYDDFNPNNSLHDFYGFNVEENIVEGRVNDPNTNEIMLDDFFARRNNIKVGDTFTFKNMYGNNSLELTVVGTFDIGVFKLIRNYTYISSSQFPSDTPSTKMLNIQVTDPNNTEFVKNEIINIIGQEDIDRYLLNDWRDTHPEIDLLDLAQKAVVLVIQILISIAVFVVVLSILGFSIQQKTQQIGILKAMGLNNYKVTNIFIYMTSILTSIGATLGLIGGVITMHLYHNYMVYADGTHRFTYRLTFLNYFISFILVFIAVIAATIIAVRRIKKNKIIDLIKT
ncbi:MAG TPA: ABC transporter permease [Acholeplasmataceae bacterium]|nr:ABC transporter permease [Acholeplasmataceae bacterium]